MWTPKTLCTYFCLSVTCTTSVTSSFHILRYSTFFHFSCFIELLSTSSYPSHFYNPDNLFQICFQIWNKIKFNRSFVVNFLANCLLPLVNFLMFISSFSFIITSELTDWSSCKLQIRQPPIFARVLFNEIFLLPSYRFFYLLVA